MTRACYRVISSAPSWRSYVQLSEQAIVELTWWIDNIDQVNGFTMQPSYTVDPLVYDVTMVGDASGVGMFLGILKHGGRTLVSKPFLDHEALESSTAREVRVFFSFYTETDLTEWQNCSIIHYTDSRAAESIMTFGSKN